MSSLSLEPDWLLTESGWRSGWQIDVRDGLVAGLGPARGGAERLVGQALLPAFVNSHSHAFQRTIRGRTEYRHPDRPSDDFWSWRELMYKAAMRLNPDQLEQVARLLYLEMAEAGITTVGEFHYQHHQPDGTRYENPDELALRLKAAADWAGVGIVLLRCAYGRSGYQVDPNPLQIRFLDRSWEESCEAVLRLRKAGLEVGLAPHSVRAVPLDWLPPLAAFAREHGLPLHMHVSEQVKEIEQCEAETGLRPVEYLAEKGILGPDFTAVHAIHLGAAEMTALGSSHVCSCPTTERNLGDGVVPARQLRRAGTRFTFGTDSQCQIDPLEDARQLDYHLRLVEQQRAVLDHPPGTMESWLWESLTAGGASSLMQPCGRLQAGLRADMLSFDLNHPTLVCDSEEWLLAQLLWSAPRESLAQVWRAGRPLLEAGKHAGRAEATAGYRRVLKELADG
ncbi:formimidoylglutamate deiminase [bacterium SCN 62-11]|nr:formimidoylglutamate deiminase [Candidatus Eremiobacteraeota bacterium]ODT65958.1 MAG: formimidoylglutamate deiminase [bacterium SCN 62-11]